MSLKPGFQAISGPDQPNQGREYANFSQIVLAVRRGIVDNVTVFRSWA